MAEIGQFWPGGRPFVFGHGQAAAELAAGFGRPLPDELRHYLDVVAPAADVDFETVGNPLTLYGLSRLGPQQPGYSFNPLSQTPIPGWNPAHFLLADEGADPVLLDLDQPALGVLRLQHGTGQWAAGETLADSLGQFILCAAALHHALTAFEDEAIIDDERGFNLAPRAAAWLFPRMRRWAGPYYDAWCSVFANA